MPPEYSFVVPVCNERETLEELYRRLVPVLDGLDGTAEVVLVDDGSTDGSFEQMLSFHERDERFKVVRLSRNFGHQIALTAGLDHARGNAVVMMDADLQDPPGGRARAREAMAGGLCRRLRGARASRAARRG